MEQIPCEWFSDSRRIWWVSLCFLTYDIEIVCGLDSLAISLLCFLFLFGDHIGNKVSSPVTTESSKEWSSSIDWINSWQACSLWAFCSSEQCRTNLAQISRFPRSSTKILRIISQLILSSSFISRRVIRQSV
jgi:hypothetical protein